MLGSIVAKQKAGLHNSASHVSPGVDIVQGKLEAIWLHQTWVQVTAPGRTTVHQLSRKPDVDDTHAVARTAGLNTGADCRPHRYPKRCMTAKLKEKETLTPSPEEM